MTVTIRMERVLRETVQTVYTDLVTRTTGRLVRTSIRERLSGSSPALARLDFSEVGLVDFSCADEVIAKLLLDPPEGAYLVLQGLREEQLEAIEHVLEQHDLAAVVEDPHTGKTRAVGRVDADQQAAFAALFPGRAATAAGLAALLGWEEPRARAALETLARLRLVRCQDGTFSLPSDA